MLVAYDDILKWHRARERTKSFKNFLGTFIEHTKQEDLKSFDIHRIFCWDDVKTMASDAMERDVDKAKLRRNPFRAAGRSLQQNASNLEVLVEFLPNNEFAGILCGALTLVFSVSTVPAIPSSILVYIPIHADLMVNKAARRLGEARYMIFNCLESLPEIIMNTETYVDIYDEDPKIWIAAEDLYLGILDGVKGMLQWIDKSAFGKHH